MTREEFQTISSEILANLADTGAVSEKLDKLRNGFNDEVTAKETATVQAAELTEKNNSLQAANMALYLKTGEKTETNEDETDDVETVTFDELFDEKGELK